MEQTPPPTPPPLPMATPVAPLNYLSPLPAGSAALGSPSWAHKAARFSWRAPVVASVVGFCTLTARSNDSTVGMAIGAINCLLIVGGLVAGIAALIGTRRFGISGIIVPAIVGICVNLLVILFVGFFLLTAFHRSTAIARTTLVTPVPSARPQLTPQQITDSVEKYPGWVGSFQTSGAVIVALSIAPDSPRGLDLQNTLPGKYLLLQITFDNSRNTGPLVVDLTNAVVKCADNTVCQPLNTKAVFQTGGDPQPAASAIRLAPAHLTVPARQPSAAHTWLFLPDDIDLHDVTAVTLSVDGTTVEIPGRVLSVDEKQENIRRSKGSG